MTKKFRMAYLLQVFERYRRSSKALKKQILDELCRVCGYNRKYAIRRLAAGPVQKSRTLSRRGHRRKILTTRLVKILEDIWQHAQYPWSARLCVILHLWQRSIMRRYLLDPGDMRILQSISPRTIDRALNTKKRALQRRFYGRTKPGTLLKHQIPIKTEHSAVDRPGFAEVDTVSHSGNNASGEFIYSVNLTDIDSGWVETRAVLGKGETGVQLAIEGMRQALPFTLVGLDSDNGSEFINHHLWRYCQALDVEFTRSRPYKKDDNAHIEQKNWTHVRRLLGWDRYDSEAALHAMNDLYVHDLTLYMNLFQPSVKLVKTERRGSRRRRFYDPPQTPLDRLIASAKGDRLKVARLKAVRQRLDPIELSTRIDKKLEKIWRLAHRRLPSAPSTRTIALSAQQLDLLDALKKNFGSKSKQQKEDGPTA